MCTTYAVNNNKGSHKYCTGWHISYTGVNKCRCTGWHIYRIRVWTNAGVHNFTIEQWEMVQNFPSVIANDRCIRFTITDNIMGMGMGMGMRMRANWLNKRKQGDKLQVVWVYKCNFQRGTQVLEDESTLVFVNGTICKKPSSDIVYL